MSDTPSPQRQLRELRTQPGMKRARLDVRGDRKRAKRLIVGIGQVHPVQSGSYSRSAAKQIADVQSWIYALCHALHRQWGVRSFGQEGFAGAEGMLRARLDPALLQGVRAELAHHGRPQNVLRRTAAEWQRALKRKDLPGIRRTTSALNALSILQALEPDVSIYPIEQKDVHGRLGEGIRAAQQQIQQAEADPAYRSARAKGGKKLSREEYDAMGRRNSLVQEYNRLLNHPERDRSIFREVVEESERSAVSVFVLGQAHRKRQMKLAREHLPADALYVWVTPPKLWWTKTMIRRTLLFLGAAAAIAVAVVQWESLPL